MSTVVACFSNAFAQQSYKITDLGVIKNKEQLQRGHGPQQSGVDGEHGWIRGPPETSTSTTIANGRAVISNYGLNIDLGTLAEPDGNSRDNYGGISDRGEAVGFSE